MSATVRISRKQLFITAFLMLPAFAVSEWASDLAFGDRFDFSSVWHGFNGAPIFAAVLALTRAE